jgi:8-oxo-dGTP pyrophosphatase MutT (NUDIX family)
MTPSDPGPARRRRWRLRRPARLRVRQAGRVILLDPGDRVLLMRYDDSNGRHWSTPGGGLNPGESFPAGAARELAEETGWTDIRLGQEVHRRTLLMDYGGRRVRQRERFYLARTSQVCREIRGVDAMHICDGIAAWRWWGLPELDSTTEIIWPRGLAALIRQLLARP